MNEDDAIRAKVDAICAEVEQAAAQEGIDPDDLIDRVVRELQARDGQHGGL